MIVESLIQAATLNLCIMITIIEACCNQKSFNLLSILIVKKIIKLTKTWRRVIIEGRNALCPYLHYFGMIKSKSTA